MLRTGISVEELFLVETGLAKSPILISLHPIGASYAIAKLLEKVHHLGFGFVTFLA